MYKRFFIIIAIVVLVSLPVAAYADVVFGNDFYTMNEFRTQKLGGDYSSKAFIVNSPSGYVIPKERPGSANGSPQNSDPLRFENGETVYLEAAIRHMGRYWGVMAPSHSYYQPGWIPMDELLAVYDDQEFEAENKDSFYTYTGSYDAVLSATRLVVWQWPGSDKEKNIMQRKDTVNGFTSALDVAYAYKDQDGREWGKRKPIGWICLSEPENSDIPAFNPAPDPAPWSPGGSSVWDYFEVIVVVALVAAALLIIRAVRKRKKGGRGKPSTPDSL